MDTIISYRIERSSYLDSTKNEKMNSHEKIYCNYDRSILARDNTFYIAN